MKTNNQPNKKAIVALSNVSNKGKTETLRQLALLILQQYPDYCPCSPAPANVPPTEDFRLVVKIGGVIVAVESQGDPNTELMKRLLVLVEIDCADIIFCSTRTKGDTVQAVEQIESKGCRAIWTSTYQVERENDQTDEEFQCDRASANKLKAQHLLELMRELKLLPKLELNNMKPTETHSDIKPNTFRGGVLLLGSLFWEGENQTTDGDKGKARKKWRDERLDAERFSVKGLPLRYGRKSGKEAAGAELAKGRGGEFTMVLWPDQTWEGANKGTAKYSRFKTYFEHIEGEITGAARTALKTEVEQLARAEGIWTDEKTRKNGTILPANKSHVSKDDTENPNIPWGLVALWLNPSLPKDNPIKDLWKDAFKTPQGKDFKDFKGIVDEHGIITLDWPTDLDSLDFVLCTPTRPTLTSDTWDPKTVAAASIEGTTKYFERTTATDIGISTDDDAEIEKQRKVIQDNSRDAPPITK